MPNNFTISVIITTYNWPEALSLSIKSLKQQKTKFNFEIVIADDGSNKKTEELINKITDQSSLPIKHIWQEDKGYRRSKILNKAIKESSGDYCVFVDGDCICPPSFIEKHARLAERNYFVAGSRILISEQYTKETLNTKIEPNHFYGSNLIKLRMQKHCNKISNLMPLPLAGLRKIFPNKWKNAKGCNLGIWKDDLIKIKGFDEKYKGWGHEDSDLIIRLINYGAKRKSGKFAAIVIHLGHPILDRSNQKQNFERLMETLNNKKTEAEVGL